jgi:hypothetical protein
VDEFGEERRGEDEREAHFFISKHRSHISLFHFTSLLSAPPIAQFVHGTACGHGVKEFTNGNHYEGNWKDNRMSGEGNMVYSSGDTYVGEWKLDDAHGHGCYTFADPSDVFSGQFREGKSCGHCVITYANGETYSGEMKDDDRNGEGVFTTARGDVFRGTWKDDEMDGVLIMTPVSRAEVAQRHIYVAGVLKVSTPLQ